MSMPIRQPEDFVPPQPEVSVRVRRRKKDTTVDDEIKTSVGRMYLPMVKTNRIPLILHKCELDDEGESSCGCLEDTGEIRIAALRGDSREDPFAPQEMDALDSDPEEVPGLLPEGGYQVFACCEDMRKRETDQNSMRLHRRRY